MDGMSPPSNRTGFRRDTTTTAHRPGSRQSNGSRLRTGRPGERSRAVTHDSPNVSGHRTSDRPSPAGAVVSSRLSGSVGNLRPRDVAVQAEGGLMADPDDPRLTALAPD